MSAAVLTVTIRDDAFFTGSCGHGPHRICTFFFAVVRPRWLGVPYTGKGLFCIKLTVRLQPRGGSRYRLILFFSIFSFLFCFVWYGVRDSSWLFFKNPVRHDLHDPSHPGARDPFFLTGLSAHRRGDARDNDLQDVIYAGGNGGGSLRRLWRDWIFTGNGVAHMGAGLFRYGVAYSCQCLLFCLRNLPFLGPYALSS